MIISSKETPFIKFYQLEGTVLKLVDSATYLCILRHKSLKFCERMCNTTNKFSRRLGFLRGNLKRCPEDLKKTAYISLVCSCAEYNAVIWEPHLAKDIDALERIQNHAIRWQGVQPWALTKFPDISLTILWFSLTMRRIIDISLLP